MDYTLPDNDLIDTVVTDDTLLSTTTLPAYSQNFAAPLIGNLPFNYSGNSIRLYYNSNGLLSYAPQNLLLQSNNFTFGVWGANNVNKGANSIVESATTTAHQTNQNIGIPVLNAWYTFAVDAKDGFGVFGIDQHRYLAFSTTGSAFGTQDYAIFNLENGTLQRSGTDAFTGIVALTDGWYRCTITLRCVLAVSSNAVFGLATPGSTGRVPVYPGNSGGIFLRNAQAAASTKAVAYAETTTAKVYMPRAYNFQDHNPATFAPRGFLIEEQRSNLLLYSQDAAQSIWTKTDTTVNPQVAISPDGTLTADQLTEGSAAGTARIYQLSAAFTAGAVITASIYLKKGSNDWVRIRLLNGVNGGDAWFNLNTRVAGTVVPVNAGTLFTSQTEQCPNGWVRCIISGKASASATTVTLQIHSATANGASGRVAGSTRYQYGAQLEEGTFATSYIPTFWAIAQRDADIATLTTTAAGFNAAAGALYAQAATRYAANNGLALDVNNLTAGQRIALQVAGAGNAGAFNVTAGGVAQATLAGGIAQANVFYKAAGAWQINDFALSVSGGPALTSNTGILPSGLTTIDIGAGYGDTGFLNGWLLEIAIYTTRLNNAELNQLTASITPGPSSGVVNDTGHTFNFTNAPGKDNVSDYEYTLNRGLSAQTLTAKPLLVGEGFFYTGIVGVRLKAMDGNPPSAWLFNQQRFNPTANYYYDAVNGNDANSGTSPAQAFKTLYSLTAKMHTMLPNSTLNIAIMPGNYEGFIENIASDTWIGEKVFNVRCYGDVVFDNSNFYGYDSAGNPKHTGPAANSSISFLNINSQSNISANFYGNSSALYARTLITADNSYRLNNAVGVTGIARVYIRDVEISKYIDGISTHGNTYCEGHNCYVHHCRKSALPMVGTSSFRMDNCIFEGMTESGDLPDGSKTGSSINFEQDVTSGILNDCEIYPSVGEVSWRFNARSPNIVFNRCKIGKYDTSKMGSWGTGDDYPVFGAAIYNDCFFNARFLSSEGLNGGLYRCYGILTINPRGNSGITETINNCVFKSGFVGGNLFYFIVGTISSFLLENSIFVNFTDTVINTRGLPIFNSQVNQRWEIPNNCFFNNTANWSPGITKPTNNLFANPLLGPCNSENQEDWKVMSGSPCIGAGVGGSDIGLGGSS